MKKWFRRLLVLCALGALGLLPFRKTELASLIPVKTVLVTRSGEVYTVDIGAGVRGMGRTLSEALEALRERVTGAVFLPTAEQIIIIGMEESDSRYADTLAAVAEEPTFRPAAGLYRCPEPELDADAVGAYLSNHASNVTVMKIRGALAEGERPALPVIRESEGGYLVEMP